LCPVAHVIATTSGSFATRSLEMIRERVDCEMPVTSARARWLSLIFKVGGWLLPGFWCCCGVSA
jgi:hypothetical protein